MIRPVIRLVSLTALTTLALAAAGVAGEFPARTTTPEFVDRFGGAPIRVLNTSVVAPAPEMPVISTPFAMTGATVIE